MFIVIRHGDNQEFLVNPNSAIKHLLHYVKDKLGLPREETIDLCDTNGSLKLLFLSKTPFESAIKILQPLEVYHVCQVIRGTPDSAPTVAFQLGFGLTKQIMLVGAQV
ncbi:hypothetical protein NDU88_000422 [Pleurodeles waltl]|uniref:Uncharacterized protein n=1 Tax=Pleurodeles waltl TaxID=8319 RepID=A0AAV7V901_PLEWA|nr:hypothetical protein NDU88_000422 [Pleurodeles waltl]